LIRLLCVGLGGMGHHDWNAAIDCGGFIAVGGVDVDTGARSVFAEKTGAPTFTDLDQALDSVEADAALVATPDRFHAPLTLRALDAGLDVICEKPMAETLRDAARMHFSALEQDRMLMIHHQLRWHPTHHEARRRIAAGDIGRLRRIDFQFSVHSDVCLRGYRSQLPHLILQDLAVHHFDLIRYLSGQECDSLYVSDWPNPETGLDITAATDAVAILNMSGPVTVSYTASIRELLDPVGYTCTARIHGTEGELAVDRQQLRLQTRAGHADGGKPQTIDPPTPEPDTWAAFARALQTREPALTHSADNLNSLSMLFAAMESAETGAVVHPATDCHAALTDAH
jgi:predicted dehydrogenase